jgi:hypothetical protein
VLTKKDLLDVEDRLNKCYGILKRADLKLDREQSAADLINRAIDIISQGISTDANGQPRTAEGRDNLSFCRSMQGWLHVGYREGRIK